MSRATTAGDYANFILQRSALPMTSDTFAEFCREMTTKVLCRRSGVVVRFVCREGRLDAALAPYIMWTAQSCSSPSGSTGPTRWTLERIARAIEYTRFPYASSSNDDLIEEEGLLLRAADSYRSTR